MKTTIGFIGQGWIGKHYADDFENRGYRVVRYSLEEPYIKNKEKIQNCRIVFIAVPTPTTEKGFSYEPVREALQNLAKGSTAVIKSTILPGVTEQLQNEFPDIFVFHSPEFLREVSAAHDAAHPDRNIIGIAKDTAEYRERAKEVMEVLPDAPYEAVVPVLEAEMVKYIGNCYLYAKVVMMNVFHDMVTASGGEWETVREALIHDPRVGESHTKPFHFSGHATGGKKTQRGAGGHCFIKDFEAFRGFYKDRVGEDLGHELLTKMVEYNNSLLISSDKDLDLLEGVYGSDIVHKKTKLK